MSIDAMKQALEALQAYGAHSSNCDHLMLLTSMPPQRKPCSCGLVANIAALRAAIEQAQELVACDGDFPEGFDASLGVPAQALRTANAIMFDVIGKREWDVPCTAQHVLNFAQKYIRPQARQWQGLTDEQALKAWNENEKHWRFENNALAFARAIEAKLREKNHG